MSTFLLCFMVNLVFQNQLMHEGKNTTGRDLARNIQRHMAKYEGVRAMKIPFNSNRNYRIHEDIPRMKIQFGAAFDSRNFKSVIGLVVWDLMRELLVLKSTLHNNVSSLFTAEAYACLEATKLGISMGMQWIKLTGDYRSIIKKCQTTSTDKSVIEAIIRDIQNKKPCFQEIIFKHIQRSGNSQAHRLAKDTLDKEETSYLVGEELNNHVFTSEGRWSRSPD
ncbi:hypothetical protein CXB51_022012 [Gossypium anomalum]|uniref:RNase H type-1 domain-containing protein n=1 Tax=Gossypium anomalum TaxID=47600 RepID=A0A8J5YUU2_9ROSI|nr:hypothetical protein CXB51_022012 [Gossypium anomalum]